MIAALRTDRPRHLEVAVPRRLRQQNLSSFRRRDTDCFRNKGGQTQDANGRVDRDGMDVGVLS